MSEKVFGLAAASVQPTEENQAHIGETGVVELQLKLTPEQDKRLDMALEMNHEEINEKETAQYSKEEYYRQRKQQQQIKDGMELTR